MSLPFFSEQVKCFGAKIQSYSVVGCRLSKEWFSVLGSRLLVHRRNTTGHHRDAEDTEKHSSSG